MRDSETPVPGLTGRLWSALQADDVDAAQALADRLARSKRVDGEGHTLLGVLILKQGDPAVACRHLRQALALQPDNPVAYANLAVARRQLGDDSGAMRPARAALACAPERADLAFNLGNLLKDQGLRDAAAATYRRALTLDPALGVAWLNLAGLYRDAERPRAAETAFRAALVCRVDPVQARVGLADALDRQGRAADAVRHLDAAVRDDPNHAGARWNRGLVLLRTGDLGRGLADFEWRWRLPGQPRRRLRAPVWQGQPVPDQTLLVHAEQGLGDTLMFCRWLPAAARRAGRVVLECQPALATLLHRAFPDVMVVARGTPLPSYDHHVALMSLPRALGVRTPPDGAVPVPYLGTRPITEGASSCGHAVAAAGPARADLRVGLVWQGGRGMTPTSWQRSVPFEALAPLWSVSGVSWVSLQVGEAVADLAAAPVSVTDLGSGFDDFLDTATVLETVDLLITIDTSVAHLAGAMGVPTWILLRARADWRWFLDRDDSPWYPTVTLFRQPAPGLWGPAVQAVARRLVMCLADSARTKRP